MDTSMIKQKMIDMATKMWATPETLKAMEADSFQASPSVTVAVVKSSSSDSGTENETDDSTDKFLEECSKLSDQDIDKMSEQEAKDYLKKVRDAEKADITAETTKETPTPNPKPNSRIMDAKVM